jgi:GNAT superfamily N-acetyltransferase
MSDSTVVVTDAPDAQSVETIQTGLGDYNVEQTGISDRRTVAVLAKDAGGRTLGGVLGRTSLGLLFLDTFYLPKSARGAGLGSRILAAAEEEGRKRGCRAAVLYTISFQAPEFYRGHGWEVFGEIPCDPPGTRRVFMTKQLRP